MGDDRVLLFDLGGVLVESTGHAALKRLLPHLEQKEIVTRWLASKSVGQFERGNIASEEFARAFLEEWQLQLEPAQFLTEFSSWVQGFFPGAERMLMHLKSRHTIGCLSNTNAIHWAQLARVRDAFDVCIASHLIGQMKPDVTAYEHALQRLGVAPNKVYFFDDLPVNVAAARSLGINAFQVRGLAETASALRGLDISTGEIG